MKLSVFLISILCFNISAIAQNLTGSELLDKAIAYHDPNGNWETFSGTLNVAMTMPDGSKRSSVVGIDLPKNNFSLEVNENNTTTEYSILAGNCAISFSEEGASAEEVNKKFIEACNKARLYSNYYTYLYGLPMKLKDPGTTVSEKVTRKNFKGKEYLVLQTSYSKPGGKKEVWFFYFNPTTYAMEVYQFFKGDPENEGKDTGEYIMLSEEKMVQGIKMPKIRAWYYNKNNELLGTDVLN